MPNTPDPSSRSDVDLVRRAFARWRSNRRRGARIPEALWRMALGLAAEHGVGQASQALHVDYYALQRRLAAAGARSAEVSATEFVEVSLPASGHVGRCQVEIKDASGDALRIDVSGLCAKDMAIFVRAIAGREPCSR